MKLVSPPLCVRRTKPPPGQRISFPMRRDTRALLRIGCDDSMLRRSAAQPPGVWRGITLRCGCAGGCVARARVLPLCCSYMDRLPVEAARDQRMESLRKAGRESLEAKRHSGNGSAKKGQSWLLS